MFDNRLKPLNLSASGGPSLGLGEVSPSSSRAGVCADRPREAHARS